MSAREMFEELGCEYKKIDAIDSVEVLDIEKNLVYQFYKYNEDKIFYIVNANKVDISFDLKTLQAINKQVEELGGE